MSLDRIEAKLDKVIEVNTKQDVALEGLSVTAKNNTDILAEHMRRTKANEDRIIIVETAIQGHLGFIRGAIWVFGFAVTIGSALLTLNRLSLI